MYIALRHVKEITGLSFSSLYRYLKAGTLVEHHRTPGGHRRFERSAIEQQFIQKKDREKA